MCWNLFLLLATPGVQKLYEGIPALEAQQLDKYKMQSVLTPVNRFNLHKTLRSAALVCSLWTPAEVKGGKICN